MFCPNCRAEYRQGFYECSDCKVALVHELPPEPKLEYVELVTVLNAHDGSTLAMAQSLLDDANLVYFVKGGPQLGTSYLFGGLIEIRVRLEDEQKAREILSELL